jgi:hypothetical protein
MEPYKVEFVPVQSLKATTHVDDVRQDPDLVSDGSRITCEAHPGCGAPMLDQSRSQDGPSFAPGTHA